MEYTNYIQPLQIIVSGSVYEQQDAFKIYREQMKGSLDEQTLDEIYPYRWNPNKPNFWRSDDLLEIGFMTAITTLESLGAINHEKLKPLRGVPDKNNDGTFTPKFIDSFNIEFLITEDEKVNFNKDAVTVIKKKDLFLSED